MGKGTALPTGVQAQLETEFKPKIKSRLLESNTGRLLVSGADVARWVMINRVEDGDDADAMAGFESLLDDGDVDC